MSNTEKIRALNDAFRTTFSGGQVLVTQGVAARDDFAEIIRQVRTFDDFNEANDPYLEHDFGAFKIGADQFYFQLECYDAALQNGSPDPSDQAVTRRVMTIFLAAER